MLKEFCRNGHRLSDDNVRIVQHKSGPYRQCIICGRENVRRSRLRRFGPTIKPTEIERFWKFVREDAETGCWLWVGSRMKFGHGQMRANGRTMLAHRFAWNVVAGREFTEGLELDHLCRNPGCVNPAHLEEVDHRTNLLRGVGVPAINAAKVSCIHGHPLSGGNLVVEQGKSGPQRRCRICLAEKSARNGAAYRERQRMLKNAN